MRSNLSWALIVIAAATIQATWLKWVAIGGALPDFVILLVVYYGLNGETERAMYTGMLGGLFQDVADATALGHHILGYVMVGYACGRIEQRLVSDHPAVKVAAAFAGALAAGALYKAIENILDAETAALRGIFSEVLPSAFYTAALTPLVFAAMRRTRKRHGAASSEPL